MIDPKLTKFRPVLTLEQLSHIASYFRTQDDDVSKSLVRVIVPMIAKVEVGAINPAYKLSEIQVLKNQERDERMRYENDLMTPEESDAYELKLLGDI